MMTRALIAIPFRIVTLHLNAFKKRLRPSHGHVKSFLNAFS